MDIAPLTPLIEDLLTAPEADPRQRAHAGNFRMEERVPALIQTRYRERFTDLTADMDAWVTAHRRFVVSEVLVDAKEGRQPWGYGAINAANRLAGVDDDVVIYRFEDARFAVEGSGISVEALRGHVDRLHHGNAAERSDAETALHDVATSWNERRDQRPMFAVSEDAIAHLLPDGDTPDPAWGEALRDYLGLGHYVPQPGAAPIELLLMRYTVSELRGHHPEATLLVPTVLDADLSPWFFPTPRTANEASTVCVGRSVNLTALGDGDTYDLGCEVIHPPFPYQATHFHAVAVLSRPVGLGLSAVMTSELSADVLRWRERFDADNLATVVATLAGHIDRGDYGRLATSMALAQLAVGHYGEVDVALHAWLEFLLKARATETDTLSARELADTLGEAFRAVALLPLPITRAWLQQHAPAARLWLGTLRFGDSRDPALPLYAAIAVDQPKQDLERFWLGLCRLPGATPDSHGRAGIVGLTHLPKVGPGLPRALFSGLIDYAQALARRGHDGTIWQAHMRLLSVSRLAGVDFWARGFREALSYRRPPLAGTAKTWLEANYPQAFLAEQRPSKRAALHPPALEEANAVLHALQSAGLDSARPRLNALLKRYRDYTRDSGDSYYLVRSFCRFSDALRTSDPVWARELAHEAAMWEPNNPHTWSMLARALEAEGDWRRAEAVFWQARRRFPDNAQAHTQLAHALLTHDQAEDSLAIHRATMHLFPNDPVCVTDYAMALRSLDRDEEALTLLRDAIQGRFPTNIPALNILTELLIDTGDLTSAEDWLRRTEELDRRQRDHNPKLDDLRWRLKQARAGEGLPPRQRQRPPEGRDGDLDALRDITGQSLADAADLGRAVLYRRSGKHAAAHARQDALPQGSERDIEIGLLRAATDPQAAVHWFDAAAERYAGDGVFQVHRQRAHLRLGETPDWAALGDRFPTLRPVMNLDPDALPPVLGDDTEAQRRRWLDARRDNPELRDIAAEDWLSVCQIL